jgi:branched-chain amino acid transport system substrate-binding protein
LNLYGKRTVILAALVVLLVSALYILPGCGSKDTGTKEPIKIGVVLSASGANEPLGKPEQNAIQLYAKRINDAGGINGYPIEVIIKDDQSDSGKAQQAAVELLEQEGIVALIGSSGTGTTIAMKQEASNKGVPQVCMAAGANIMDGDYSWIFRTPPTATEAGNKVLAYIEKVLGLKRIALLYDTNAFGTDGKTVLEKEAANYGVEVVVSEGYKTDESEEGMDTHLTNIQTANPEVVVVWGTNPGPAKIAKRMKDKGMKQPYIGSHGIANQAFIELAGDAANGVVFPAGKMLIYEEALKPGTAEYNFIKDFSDAYYAEYGEQINTFAGHGWDAMLVIVEALKKAGPTSTSAQLRDELEKTEGLIGTAGIFTYLPQDHNGLSPEDLIMVEIAGGKWGLAQQP